MGDQEQTAALGSGGNTSSQHRRIQKHQVNVKTLTQSLTMIYKLEKGGLNWHTLYGVADY